MPFYIRSLIVIMVLSSIVLWLGRPYATLKATLPDDYRRRALSWVVITLAMFLSHSYYLFLILSLPLMVIAGGKDSNRLAYFAFLIFVVPTFPFEITGSSALNSLIKLDHMRWLSLAVLLPAWWSLRSKPGVTPFGRTTVDKFIFGYIALWLTLQAMSTTVTNLVRISFYMFLEIFLPYYVASRGARDMKSFRDVIMAFVVAVLIMAPTGVVEFARKWLLYNSINEVMGLPYWGLNNYLQRGEGVLRASVTTGHPIVLGYLMSIALGLNAFLRPSTKPGLWKLAVLGLCGGIVAAMSRGPWVGAAAMLLVLIATGPKVGSRLMQVSMLGLLMTPLLFMTEQGQKILDYLPFVGTVESQNVEFRARLLDVSLGVLAKFPFFGALDFINDPDMEQMRGSDGIIDIVNTYLGVAMATGVVGLTIFVAPFVIVCFGIARRLFAGGLSPDSEEHLLGRALLATLVGIMVTIGTVAAISVVAYVYLFIVGLGAAYVESMTAAARAPAQQPAPRPAAEPPPSRRPPRPQPGWATRGRPRPVRGPQ
jgi:hypothetical protein